MTISQIFHVVSYTFAVVQPVRGQAGVGLTLHFLLDNETAGETTAFLQLGKGQVWMLRDTCAGMITSNPDKYAGFLAKTRAFHQLSYGDKFLKTLPATDFYGNFHRRRSELPIAIDYLTAMHPARTGELFTAAPTKDGLLFRFTLGFPEPMVLFFADDLVFMMVDTIDQAVWAAEWERDGLSD